MDKRKTQRMGIRLSVLGGVLLTVNCLAAITLSPYTISVQIVAFLTIWVGLAALAAGLVLRVVSACLKDAI